MSLENIIKQMEIRIFDSLFMDFQHFYNKHYYLSYETANQIYKFNKDFYSIKEDIYLIE